VATKRLPSVAPGLQDAADTAQIRAVAGAMNTHLVTDEKTTGMVLAGLLQPDFATGTPAIGFVHRKLGDSDIYFVANTSNQPIHTQATLRQKGFKAEWWDPFEGQPVEGQPESTSELRIDLEPYESRVLFLQPSAAIEDYAQPAHVSPAPIDITSGWKMTFDKTGRSTNATALRSWTDDPATQFYSGTVTYEKSIHVQQLGQPVILDFGSGTPLPPQKMANGMRAWLDPPVRECAVVYANGKLTGYLWHPPFRIEITKLISQGANTIQLVVGNTAINSLAGQSLPGYKLLKLKYGDRFQPQDMENLQPLPSGILGRITLR
jgi:hypothetical protein